MKIKYAKANSALYTMRRASHVYYSKRARTSEVVSLTSPRLLSKLKPLGPRSVGESGTSTSSLSALCKRERGEDADEGEKRLYVIVEQVLQHGCKYKKQLLVLQIECSGQR
jgi:hypothetical protein